MKTSFTAVDKIPEQLNNLHRAIIDSSSIIYLHKIGQFGNLCRIINLVTIPEVIKECGETLQECGLEVVVFDSRVTDGVDERILAGASRLHLPVISDDGQMLFKAKQRGHLHYNTLMMVCYLYYKGVLDNNSVEETLKRLYDIAWYQESNRSSR